MTQSLATKGNMAISNEILDLKQLICNHEIRKMDPKTVARFFFFRGTNCKNPFGEHRKHAMKITVLRHETVLGHEALYEYKEHDAIENRKLNNKNRRQIHPLKTYVRRISTLHLTCLT